MDSEAIKRALEHGKLTSYQADVYVTLLDLGSAPAVEVGRKCSVPVSQIYDVLRDLEEVGYVETIEREKLYAQPREPETVLEDLQSRGELLTDAAAAIEERYEQPEDIESRIGVTKRPETAVKHAIDLIEEAETVVEIATTTDQLQAMLPELRAARERGVVVRVSVDTTAECSIAESDLEGAVSELRVCSIPGPFLVVIDRHRVSFAPNSRSDESYGVLVHDRILPFVFHWYFLTCLWNLYPMVYVDDPETVTYVTLEEFVEDFVDLYRAGYDLEIRIRGTEIETDAETTITGTVESITYTNSHRSDRRPTLTELGTYTTMVLETDDGRVSVGSWGAIFEDVDARRIDLLGIDRPRESDDAVERDGIRPIESRIPIRGAPRPTAETGRGADASSVHER